MKIPSPSILYRDDDPAYCSFWGHDQFNPECRCEPCERMRKPLMADDPVYLWTPLKPAERVLLDDGSFGWLYPPGAFESEDGMPTTETRSESPFRAATIFPSRD